MSENRDMVQEHWGQNDDEVFLILMQNERVSKTAGERL